MGAGKGIGRATALTLAAAGAQVVVLDRHRDRAETVAEEIREAGGWAAICVADTSALESIPEVLREAERRCDGLEIVVHITGSASWVPLLEMDAGVWERDLHVNLEQPLRVGRHSAELLKEHGRRGVLCFVASVSGVFASPGHAAYGAAKAGLLSMVRTAAEEWWPSGLRVNAVVPGSVRTPRIEETLMEGAVIPEEMLARMASPKDIAGPIAFLVSPLARKVTGQTIVIDGGTSTRFPYALA